MSNTELKLDQLSRWERSKVMTWLSRRMRYVGKHYPRIDAVVSGREPMPDKQLLAELKDLLATTQGVLNGQLTVPPEFISRLEADRIAYLRGDEGIPAADDDPNDINHLSRRIHHQRLALREFQRLYDSLITTYHRRTAVGDMASGRDGQPLTVGELAERCRGLGHRLQRANRLLDVQAAEMAKLMRRLTAMAAADKPVEVVS